MLVPAVPKREHLPIPWLGAMPALSGAPGSLGSADQAVNGDNWGSFRPEGC